VISAKDHFEHPTSRVNVLWQTDFSYLKVIDWGWYYLLTFLDDYSRYIIAWRLYKSIDIHCCPLFSHVWSAKGYQGN
jgi:transposase InsO family protein